MQSPFSRRSFLTGTSAAALSVAAAHVFGQPATGPAPKKLGVALVGIGSLTMNQILPAFAKCTMVKPVALVSGHPDKAKAQAAKYNLDAKNIYNYDNYDTIKDNPDIDMVYIVLPNGMHAEYTIRAAKAGKHVLCEKPMANTPEECQAMIDACNAAKKKLFVAYRMHYEPMTLKAIEIARGTGLGTVKQISADCGFSIGDPTQWRLNKKLAGGGSFMDIGIYALNAVRYLSGQEPTQVTAFSYATPDDVRFKEVEETISVELQFKSGLQASVLSTYGFGCGRYRVYGTRGTMEAEPFMNYGGNRLYPTGRSRAEFTYTPVDHFGTEMDAFSDAIQNDKPILTPGEEGLKDMKVIAASYESAKTGKTVKIV